MEENYLSILKETEARSKSNTKRLDELKDVADATNELAKSVAEMVVEQKHQTEAVTELKADVKTIDAKVGALESKPGQRWDKIVEYIVCTVIGLIVGYVFKGIF